MGQILLKHSRRMSLDCQIQTRRDGGDEDVMFTDVEEVLSNGTPEGQCFLTPHLRRASHTLNLISTNDVDKWLTANPESRSVYRRALPPGLRPVVLLWPLSLLRICVKENSRCRQQRDGTHSMMPCPASLTFPSQR